MPRSLYSLCCWHAYYRVYFASVLEFARKEMGDEDPKITHHLSTDYISEDTTLQFWLPDFSSRTLSSALHASGDCWLSEPSACCARPLSDLVTPLMSGEWLHRQGLHYMPANTHWNEGERPFCHSTEQCKQACLLHECMRAWKESKDTGDEDSTITHHLSSDYQWRHNPAIPTARPVFSTTLLALRHNFFVFSARFDWLHELQLLYEWHAWPLRKNWTRSGIVSHGQAEQHPFPRICLLDFQPLTNRTLHHYGVFNVLCFCGLFGRHTKCCVTFQVFHYWKINPETYTLSSWMWRFRTDEDLHSQSQTLNKVEEPTKLTGVPVCLMRRWKLVVTFVYCVCLRFLLYRPCTYRRTTRCLKFVCDLPVILKEMEMSQQCKFAGHGSLFGN